MWSNARSKQGSYVVEKYGRPLRTRTADLYRVNRIVASDATGLGWKQLYNVDLSTSLTIGDAGNAMVGMKVTILRYISDEPQPGIVECELEDAYGRSWSFIDKTAI